MSQPLPELEWAAPPQRLALPHEEIHVWRAPLDLATPSIAILEQTLAADESDRAGRFVFEKDRGRFIAGRGWLRAILARYLDADPAKFAFQLGARGKPALSGRHASKDLRFNVSHSEGLALYAFARGREIGVDLERVSAAIAQERIPEHFFSPAEVAALRALPLREQDAAFFACWTRKEAYVKAKGDGLSLRLDQFDVSLVPGEPAKLLRAAGDPQEAARWSLVAFTPAPEFRAALAVEGPIGKLLAWQLDGAA